ncbi:hypothetical protein [Wenzhouxiangella marina]|nr:hypothetical protein [Wenzhouxiangella marina]
MALSPPPPQPDDFLLPALYEALDGDNWINNDGWLDPDVHWCDWYGVTCGEEYWPGLFEFDSLNLSGNGLTGEFGTQVLDYFERGVTLPDFVLDLSDNAISGPLSALPVYPRVVLMNDNQFDGNLPVPAPLDAHLFPVWRLEVLDLSGNGFSGTIPALWADRLRLLFLNLNDNRLEGSIEAAVHALDPDLPAPSAAAFFTGLGLWLADNDFSGELDPAWFEDREVTSFNLCWTELQIDDPQLGEWIAERHWGGDPAQCLNQARLPLDPSVSGSWFDPRRSGEGFSLMLLEDGTPLVYWFSHISNNRQLWLFNSGGATGTTARFQPLLRTRGEFDLGLSDLEFPLVRGGALRLDRTGPSLLHAEFSLAYTGYDIAQPGDIQITWPPQPDIGRRSDHIQLSRLAGTNCENQQAHQWISGAWFDPERSGEGFVVEVIEDGRGVVYWFTYTPPGTNDERLLERAGDWQVWMTGDGQFDGNTLTIDPLYRPQDTGFLMPGGTEFIDNLPIGTLQMIFQDDQSGSIQFTSSDPDFPSTSYPIERLARPMLVDCD